eukprot:IDg5165t1
MSWSVSNHTRIPHGRVVMTERVALLAVEWLRQAYSHLNARNVQDLQALLDRASAIFLTWFEWEGLPLKSSVEAADYFQRTASWIPFDLWDDEVLSSEGARVTRIKSRPTYCDGNGSWGAPVRVVLQVPVPAVGVDTRGETAELTPVRFASSPLNSPMNSLIAASPTP